MNVAVIFSGRTNKAVIHHDMFNTIFGNAEYYFSCCPKTCSEDIDKVIQLYKPTDFVTDEMPSNVNSVCMFYNRKRAFDLIKNLPDIVVSARFDIYIKEYIFHPLSCHRIEDNTIYIPSGQDWGGLNDQFAYGNYESMSKYCNLYKYIDSLELHDFHPETLLKKYIEKVGLNVVRTKKVYELISDTRPWNI